ncbi:MAG: NirD/YgiW/YdeI family stress tolerance protein [Methanotrichaceae archaeon]|nr:NirD/YgiW/YdeI family stress tolerance protein [Methanotrichaceae archaeon]
MKFSNCTKVAFLAIGLFLVMTCPVLSQSNNSTSITIGKIIANPIVGSLVTVNGQVVEDLGFGHYLFSDETGRIQLDAPDFPKAWLPLNEDMTIVGEADRDEGILEIQVLWSSMAP